MQEAGGRGLDWAPFPEQMVEGQVSHVARPQSLPTADGNDSQQQDPEFPPTCGYTGGIEWPADNRG